MTREKTIRKILDTVLWTRNASDFHKNILTDAIVEALEQESIFDKLRAELHATAEMHEDGDYYLRDEWIDEYFDKYKAESEEEDADSN